MTRITGWILAIFAWPAERAYSTHERELVAHGLEIG
jgi:hypothetical protein